MVLLLSVLASQQLWLWNVIQPDTASDTLVLYALSTLNFVAFVVFSFIFMRSLLKLRRERRSARVGFENQDTPAGLFHRHQLSADYGDGYFFLSVFESLARKVVQQRD